MWRRLTRNVDLLERKKTKKKKKEVTDALLLTLTDNLSRHHFKRVPEQWKRQTLRKYH